MIGITNKSRNRRRARWLIAGAALTTGAIATLAVLAQPDATPAPRMSRLEQEAAARFAGAEPYVRLPDGRKFAATNPAHRLQIKVSAYQGMLAKQSEQRDPTFALRAEAELVRRTPMRAVIEWNDVTGNRQMTFTIEDSSTCALDGKTELVIAVEDIARYPCLTQGGTFWDPGTSLTVNLTPVEKPDPLWAELLHATKKAMATEEHFASASAEATEGS
jgi:hypothetical protein